MSHKKGFTLIELVVVMALIAILAALAVGGIVVARRMTIETAHRNNARLVVAAVNRYYGSHNAYPGQGWALVLGQSSAQTTLGINASSISPDPAGVCIYTYVTPNVPSYGVYLYGKPASGSGAAWDAKVAQATSAGVDTSRAEFIIVTYNYDCTSPIEYRAIPE